MSAGARSIRARILVEWLVVLAVTAGAITAAVALRLTVRLDTVFYDAVMRLQAPLPTRTTIVAIDDRSLRELGRWPWARSVHARLLDALTAVHPASIGYDVLFVEPARDDRALAAALARARRVVLPMAVAVPGDDGAAFSVQRPTPVLGRAARGLGHVMVQPDADGIVRRTSLLIGDRAMQWPALAEQVVRVAAGHRSSAFARTAAMAGDQDPLSAPVLMPFAADRVHPTVSAAALLRGEVPASLLAGRMLLIGSTAEGSGDRYAVPGGALPGVEVIAAMVDALTADRLIRTAAPPILLAFALGATIAMLTALLLLPPRTNLIGGLALLAFVLAVPALLLTYADLWLPPTAALIGVLLPYPLWAWRRLAAVSGYMTGELRRLEAGPDPLPVPAPRAAAWLGWVDETTSRQTALMTRAVTRTRDLRRFFADSIAALPDATVILDRDERVLVLNRAATALFGPAAAGQPIARLMAATFPVAQSATQRGEGEMTASDGRIFVRAAVPLTQEDGKTAGCVLRLTDITALRLASRQREQALQLLTHDMRAPQAAILALLDRQDAAERLGRIAGYARRTLQLADDFVLLARAETAPFEPQLLDLTSLLIEAADDVWPLAAARSVQLDTPDGSDELLVAGDHSLLVRMLINLIGNAIKHSPDGATVRCTVARATDAETHAPMLACRIADEGPGVAAADAEAIFQPFRRAPGASTHGAGLGLAFVRTVATRHGGGVTVGAAPGRGAVFTVCLPAAADPDGR